ncbi:hypothetical protein Dimus_017159 [Dionaea muscipula]
MAPSSHPKLVLLICLLLLLLLTHICAAEAQLDDPSSLNLIFEAMDQYWPSSSSSSAAVSHEFDDEPESDDGDGDGDGDGEYGTTRTRRSLLWGAFHFYISYAALSANRIPCPPRSGRSYYTYNCYRARGPVRPYYRGCSAITRCRR